MGDSFFNRLTANYANIKNLTIESITSDKKKINTKTDSPFKIGDIISNTELNTIYIENYQSNIDYNINQNRKILNQTTIIIKDVLYDDPTQTIYLVSLKSLKGYSTNNMLLIYGKIHHVLSSHWITKTGNKKKYKIYFNNNNFTTGYQNYFKNQSFIKTYIWKVN